MNLFMMLHPLRVLSEELMRDKYLRGAICNGEVKHIYRIDARVNERFRFNQFISQHVWLIHSLTLETPIILDLISAFSKRRSC